MGKTIVVQIGNSDNKLTQGEWAQFCAMVKDIVAANVRVIHFQGGSDWDAPWQNACWVCEAMPETSFMERLLRKLTECRKTFTQDSVAVTFGATEFV